MIGFIYSIFIWIFMFLYYFASGEVRMIFLGLELGVLIGQIIYCVDVFRRYK